jgi:hypothetical protein
MTTTPTPPPTPSAEPVPSSPSTASPGARMLMRIGLLILAFQGLLSGVWATATPRGFFDDFPGFGMSWVAPDGPFNEHLVRDYGALNLALGVVALCAAIWLTRGLVIAAALSWIVYSIPHIAYHAINGGSSDTSDHVAIVTSLLFAPIVAVVVLWSMRRTEQESARLERSPAASATMPHR